MLPTAMVPMVSESLTQPPHGSTCIYGSLIARIISVTFRPRLIFQCDWACINGESIFLQVTFLLVFLLRYDWNIGFNKMNACVLNSIS